MGSQSDKGSKLLNWCALNKIEIDPRLAIVEDSTSGDISVHNASDEFILDSTIRNVFLPVHTNSADLRYQTSGDHTQINNPVNTHMLAVSDAH